MLIFSPFSRKDNSEIATYVLRNWANFNQTWPSVFLGEKVQICSNPKARLLQKDDSENSFTTFNNLLQNHMVN